MSINKERVIYIFVLAIVCIIAFSRIEDNETEQKVLLILEAFMVGIGILAVCLAIYPVFLHHTGHFDEIEEEE